MSQKKKPYGQSNVVVSFGILSFELRRNLYTNVYVVVIVFTITDNEYIFSQSHSHVVLFVSLASGLQCGQHTAQVTVCDLRDSTSIGMWEMIKTECSWYSRCAEGSRVLAGHLEHKLFVVVAKLAINFILP